MYINTYHRYTNTYTPTCICQDIYTKTYTPISIHIYNNRYIINNYTPRDTSTCTHQYRYISFFVCLYASGALTTISMGFAVRVRPAGQKYGPACHQRDRADVTEFVTLVRLSPWCDCCLLGSTLASWRWPGYKRRKSALKAGPIVANANRCHGNCIVVRGLIVSQHVLFSFSH